MSYISKIDLSTAPQEVRAAVDNHLAQGYQLTNEKLTLLHNVTAFHTLEESSYELDRELQRLICHIFQRLTFPQPRRRSAPRWITTWPRATS